MNTSKRSALGTTGRMPVLTTDGSPSSNRTDTPKRAALGTVELVLELAAAGGPPNMLHSARSDARRR